MNPQKRTKNPGYPNISQSSFFFIMVWRFDEPLKRGKNEKQQTCAAEKKNWIDQKISLEEKHGIAVKVVGQIGKKEAKNMS